MPAEPYTAEALALRPHPYADAPAASGAGRIAPEEVGRGDVLVLRALGLGDALTGVAPLRGLRRLFPARRIVLAAPAAIGGWLVGLDVVQATLSTPGLVPLRGLPGGHVAVDLHGRGPASQRLLTGTRPDRLIAFDCPEVGHRGPRWDPDEHEVLRWCRLVGDAGGPCSPDDLRLRGRDEAGERWHPDGPVVLHPGAASGSRRWPADRWRGVLAELRARGRQVVVTGSADERELAAAVVGRPGDRPGPAQRPGESASDVENLAGSLNLSGLLELVAGASLVISGDTGMAHLATALATPSVVLFGPVPPHRWGPVIDPDLHRVLWHGDPHAGRWGDPHAGSLDPRLERITVGEVLEAIDDLWDRCRPRRRARRQASPENPSAGSSTPLSTTSSAISAGSSS